MVASTVLIPRYVMAPMRHSLWKRYTHADYVDIYQSKLVECAGCTVPGLPVPALDNLDSPVGALVEDADAQCVAGIRDAVRMRMAPSCQPAHTARALTRRHLPILLPFPTAHTFTHSAACSRLKIRTRVRALTPLHSIRQLPWWYAQRVHPLTFTRGQLDDALSDQLRQTQSVASRRVASVVVIDATTGLAARRTVVAASSYSRAACATCTEPRACSPTTRRLAVTQPRQWSNN